VSEIVWHKEAITAETEETLGGLRERSLLGNAYLAGGTALALRFGHRRSLDLDFFEESLFDEGVLIQRLQTMPAFSLVSKALHTVHATIGVTKVSFLGYSYPVLFPAALFLGVPVADPRDVTCMKISAVASRGTKRDFLDLYVASQQFGLTDILAWFARKYVQTRYSRTHVLKSLTYFQDAELDPMPDMLVDVDWNELKHFFRREVTRLI
jgi:Nucleotidyl transferase AbiEii toxin, Type IV TA system